MRASLVVKCQLTCRWSVLTDSCQAVSSWLRTSRSSIRRSRHCRLRAASSISAMLSQEPCLGVYRAHQHRRRSTRRGLEPHRDHRRPTISLITDMPAGPAPDSGLRRGPELNPVEPVWSHLKRSLANLAKHTIGELTALVKTRLRRMQYRPGLLVGFLASTGFQFGPFL